MAIHKMNLSPLPFEAVSSGRKTVEMRLNDEKRADLNIGDTIEFEHTDTHEKILCKVIKLTPYRNFFELYAHCEKTAIGYRADETARAEDMYAYYSPERIEKYGVLAIKIKLL